MKCRGSLIVGLAVLAGLSQAAPNQVAPKQVAPVQRPPIQSILNVTFASVPGLLYNRQGGSTLTVISAAGMREIKLGGVIDKADKHYWSNLNPLRLRLAVGGPIKLQTRLYVCDQRAGLCSVRTLDQIVPVGKGGVLNVTLEPGRLAGL